MVSCFKSFVFLSIREDRLADPQLLGAGSPFVKGPWYTVCAIPSSHSVSAGSRLDLFTEMDKEIYRNQRRAIGPAYSVASIEKHEMILNGHIDTYIAKLREMKGQWLDLSDWMHIYALDALSHITLGHSPGHTAKGHDDGNAIASDKTWAYFTVVGIFPGLVAFTQSIPKVGLYLMIPISLAFGLSVPTGLPIFRYAVPKIMERLAKAETAKMVSMPEDRVGVTYSRTKNDKSKKIATRYSDANTSNDEQKEEEDSEEAAEDLLATLLQEQAKKGDRFPAQWVLHIATTNFGAGHDTTTISLSAIMYHLASNPAALARLTKDLKDADIRRETPYTAIVNRVPYMQACMKEAMRLHPAIGSHLQRVVPSSGASFSGYHLPAGTHVGVNLIAVHRDPAIFEDPESFKPERWLQDGTDEQKQKIGRLDQIWLGFGGGSRSCPGQYLAKVLMVRLVVRLVQEFEFEVRGRPFIKGWVSAHLSGVDVLFKPKEEAVEG
jgi:cytochrome P450